MNCCLNDEILSTGNHAKLTQLSTSLVEAINMYHTLMNEGIPSYRQFYGPYPQQSGKCINQINVF